MLVEGFGTDEDVFRFMTAECQKTFSSRVFISLRHVGAMEQVVLV